MKNGPHENDGGSQHLSPRRHPHRLDDDAYLRQGVPVFFTICTAHRREFLLEPGVPEMLVEAMDWNAKPRGTCIVCYCIMPDHVHLIACNTREGEDLRDFVAAVKKRAWRLFRDAGLEPPFWERSYWDRHARACVALEAQVEYVLNNPCKAGLCRRPEEWPYQEYRGFHIPSDDEQRRRRERGPASP